MPVISRKCKGLAGSDLRRSKTKKKVIKKSKHLRGKVKEKHQVNTIVVRDIFLPTI